MGNGTAVLWEAPTEAPETTLIVTPVLPATATTVLTVTAARGNAQALSAANTMFANYFGLPAISVTCGVDSHRLPMGLQIVGSPWNEGAVLRLARQYHPGTSTPSLP